ncbi:MAG: dehydratase [Armatimonadetes bacterium]|nr:dehydratase [Armatimonadota bacterium]
MPDRFFEEYEIGERWRTRGRTVTEADVVNFAGISGDFFPLHMDAEYAKGTRFGHRIAHGMLTLSMATGLVPADPEKVEAFYGMDAVRFVRPVFIGDTVHVEMEVAGKTSRDDGSGVVDFKQTVVNQQGKAVLTNQYRLLIRKRPKE